MLVTIGSGCAVTMGSVPPGDRDPPVTISADNLASVAARLCARRRPAAPARCCGIVGRALDPRHRPSLLHTTRRSTGCRDRSASTGSRWRDMPDCRRQTAEAKTQPPSQRPPKAGRCPSQRATHSRPTHAAACHGTRVRSWYSALSPLAVLRRSSITRPLRRVAFPTNPPPRARAQIPALPDDR